MEAIFSGFNPRRHIQAEILKNLPNAFRHATNDVCEILYKGLQRILMGNFGANDVRSSTKVPKGFPFRISIDCVKASLLFLI
jgi:hypothetical protein